MKYVQLGHLSQPEQFPKDFTGQIFPVFVLSCKKENGEKLPRELLVFSPSLTSFFCLPCRLFSSNLIHSLTKFLNLQENLDMVLIQNGENYMIKDQNMSVATLTKSVI